jgi:hypothetical protein
MQKGASFNLEAVKAQIEKAMQAHADQQHVPAGGLNPPIKTAHRTRTRRLTDGRVKSSKEE